MNRKLVLCSLLIIILCTCKSGALKEVSSQQLSGLHDELMKLHEETMIKHGESLALMDQLKEKKQSTPDAIGVTIDSLHAALDHSNEAMMDWMANFTDPVSKDSVALVYLLDQILLMKQIASDQIKNITSAKTILESK